ncbi:MAG: DUF1415 domain-containing protein [Legionella sp.]|nr:MAG: DUF1415 domain-containing protein [Legionella sp.]
MNNYDSPIAQDTLDWVLSFVIHYNLCPFAKGPVNKGQLKIQVCDKTKKAQALEELMMEIHYLDQHPEIETTLFVFSQLNKDFFTYLDFVDLADHLLTQHDYDGIYQFVSFHPDYYFADSEPDDPANLTNRSPYPMIHILREEQLEKVIAVYGDTSEIPKKNIELLRSLNFKGR